MPRIKKYVPAKRESFDKIMARQDNEIAGAINMSKRDITLEDIGTAIGRNRATASKLIKNPAEMTIGQLREMCYLLNLQPIIKIDIKEN